MQHMGFELYGAYHWCWLIGSLIVVILTSKYYKSLEQEKRKSLQRNLAWFLLLFELYKDLHLIMKGEFTLAYFPFDLCGFAIFAIFYHAYTNSFVVGEMLYNLFLPGAIAAMLFCNWTHRPIYEFMSIFSFVFHLVLIVYCVMVLHAGVVKPNIKRIWSSIVFLTIAGFTMYPLNKLWDTNYLFLNVPSPGSPLVPLEQIFGNPGYIFGLALLIVAIWGLLYVPWRKLFRVGKFKREFIKQG